MRKKKRLSLADFENFINKTSITAGENGFRKYSQNKNNYQISFENVEYSILITIYVSKMTVGITLCKETVWKYKVTDKELNDIFKDPFFYFSELK